MNIDIIRGIRVNPDINTGTRISVDEVEYELE